MRRNETIRHLYAVMMLHNLRNIDDGAGALIVQRAPVECFQLNVDVRQRSCITDVLRHLWRPTDRRAHAECRHIRLRLLRLRHSDEA